MAKKQQKSVTIVIAWTCPECGHQHYDEEMFHSIHIHKPEGPLDLHSALTATCDDCQKDFEVL